ncbi:kelch repeat protein, partial [Opisthorchis viverrini]
VARTVTAETASHLARAAVNVLATSSSEDSFCGASSNGRTTHTPDNNYAPCFPVLPRLIEARSGAGAGCLCVDGKHHLILVGGYARKGCLVSVEVHTRSGSSSDPAVTDNPQFPYYSLDAAMPGPRLSKPRGRLALAHSFCSTTDGLLDVLYVCGGSNGSVDLNTAERLTSSALSDWLAEHAERVTEVVPNSSLRNSSTTINSGCHQQAAVWQPIARMNQARSSPAATGLDDLTAGTLVTSTRGSMLVAGGLAGAVALSSVEAYIPERDQWIQLPDMCTSRYEAACATLGSKNLVLVVGGDGSSFRRHDNNNDALVEALDPRCSNWIPLPSFNPGGHGKLRGAALVHRPATEDGLLLIAGFNGQDTLNRTWLFDPTAWQWLPGPFLSTARTNPCAITWPDRSATFVLGGFNGTASATGFLDSIEMISYV